MRAIIIANHGDADGGEVAHRFARLGWSFETWNRERAPEWEPLPDDVGLVVPLGSDWSVYWDDVAPFVAAEAELLRVAHGRRVPIFGVCFGGQMLAHALGGRVERADQPEIGWFSVDPNPEMTPFLAENPPFHHNPWFQWHYDRFVPPMEATVLATGAQGTQAFLLDRSLGLQFHPEVTPAIIERWSTGHGAVELARVGVDPEALAAATRSHAHVSAHAAHRVVDWFTEHVMPLR
ncbi:MAG: gamma-glutamyl-gamma-aminobutyrate hydrolase family protein [Acidobacteria bacterium]|nr:gamma-glutamyl-gamma-aminobutyrate hydrolase family protein [Acidobacteriota bacterium]